MILDNSGGSLAIDQDFGWIDRATITPAREVQGEKILDVHLYLGSPISGDLYDWLHHLGSGEPSQVLVDEGFGSQPVVEEFDRECRSNTGKVFVSELGCAGMSDLDETVAGFGGREDLLDARELKLFRDSLNQGFQERGLGRIFGSKSNMFKEAQRLQAIGNTQHLEALLSNPRISGYVITQLNDVAYEFHAGLVDLWRNPKLAYAAAQRVNQPKILILKVSKEVANPGDGIDVKITLVNGLPLPHEAHLEVAVFSSNQNVAASQHPVPLRPGIHPLASVQVEIGAPGEYQVSAQLIGGGETLAESIQTILALEAVDWQNLAVRVKSWGKPPDSNVFQDEVQEKTNRRDMNGKPAPMVNLAAFPATLSGEEWNNLLQAVEAGEACIVGALRPQDEDVVRVINHHGVNLKLHPGIGSWMGCYHWISDSPVFSGLPSGGLAMKPYADVLPKYVLSEMGGDVLAGSFRNTQTRLEPPAMLWYSDIEALELGKGVIWFCQYRVFEKIDRDRAASRLAFNLFQLAAQKRAQNGE